MANNRWPFRRRPLKIFISYRREDSMDSAGRLYSDLKLYFNRPFRKYLGRKVIVVRDFDDIPGGINWRTRIVDEIKTSAAFITIIGKEWLSSPDPKTGQQRLNNPRDTHRVEIATALSLSIPVFPVLVEGASMPDEEELPDELKSLASQNAKSISDPGWDAKVEALIEDLELILTSKFSPLVRIGSITFLIFLLGALSVLGIVKYTNCCPDNTNTQHGTNSTLNTNGTSSAVTNTSPVTNTPGPAPTTTPTQGVTPSPVTTPTIPVSIPPVGGSMWDYEQIGNSGTPIHGYVISFDSNGTYIFRCVNKDSYPNKCRNVEWIDSKYASHERRWELNGNRITIFWNRGTKDEVKDVGVIEIGGNRMNGTGQDTANIYSPYSWIAMRRN